jgi:hypothetical protein
MVYIYIYSMIDIYGGSHKSRYPNRWMVCFMGNPIEMDDLGVLPHFRKHQFFFFWGKTEQMHGIYGILLYDHSSLWTITMWDFHGFSVSFGMGHDFGWSLRILMAHFGWWLGYFLPVNWHRNTSGNKGLDFWGCSIQIWKTIAFFDDFQCKSGKKWMFSFLMIFNHVPWDMKDGWDLFDDFQWCWLLVMKENTDGEYQCFFFPNDFSSLVWAIYKWGIRIKPFSLKNMIKFQNRFFFAICKSGIRKNTFGWMTWLEHICLMIFNHAEWHLIIL